MGDLPQAGVVQGLLAVVPVFGTPEVDLAHAGGFAVAKAGLQPLGVQGFVLLGQAGLLDALAVGWPGFGLELGDHHVSVVEDFLGAGDEAVKPGWLRIFQVAVGDAGIPHPLVHRDAEFVGLRLPHWQAEGIIAAADNHWVLGVEPLHEIVLVDQPLAVKIGADAKTTEEILIF